MKLRIYTNDSILDIDIKDIYTQQDISDALAEGNTLALTKEDENMIILNTINCVAIEIIPPISD